MSDAAAAMMTVMNLAAISTITNTNTNTNTSRSSALKIALSITASVILLVALFLCYIHFIHHSASAPCHSTRRARIRGGDLELAMLYLRRKDLITKLYFQDNPGVDAREKVFSRRELREMLRVGSDELRAELRECGFEREVEKNQGRDWWLEDDEEKRIGEDKKSFSQRDMEEMAKRWNWAWQRKVASKMKEGGGKDKEEKV